MDLSDGKKNEMISKFEYLAKTLSRTQRKDYENYVVNAVYNRLNDKRIVPVSQQYITNPNSPNGYYLIDLYFPQLNVGIECDESYHKSQMVHDKEREITITDVLKGIRSDSDYEPIHIDVSSNDILIIDEEIDNAVHKLKERIIEKENKNYVLCWENVFPKNCFEIIKEKKAICIKDIVSFKTISQVENELFGKQSKHQQHSCFFIGNIKVWFPKLAIDGKARVRGWNNQVSKDGETIREYNEKWLDSSRNEEIINGEERVVFAKSFDPITNEDAYRFIGIYKQIMIQNGCTIYKRINEVLKLPEQK